MLVSYPLAGCDVVKTFDFAQPLVLVKEHSSKVPHVDGLPTEGALELMLA
jgi:hypothetical protein